MCAPTSLRGRCAGEGGSDDDPAIQMRFCRRAAQKCKAVTVCDCTACGCMAGGGKRARMQRQVNLPWREGKQAAQLEVGFECRSTFLPAGERLVLRVNGLGANPSH